MSNLNEFDYGTTVRLQCLFHIAKVLTDPTTVSLDVTDPAGTVVNYTHPATITKDAVGTYHIDRLVSLAGEWTQKWTATGTVAAVDTRKFLVRRTGV